MRLFARLVGLPFLDLLTTIRERLRRWNGTVCGIHISNSRENLYTSADP
jgi:hypothetical protein